MESNLSLLVVLSQPVALAEWLPKVIKEQVGLVVAPDQLADNPDIHLINTDDETVKIDQVRKLQELSSYTPYHLARSVYVLQRIETASTAAQNSLLKLLEEPPAHAVVILTTQQLNQVLPTIQSRCLILNWHMAGEPFQNPEMSHVYQQIMASTPGELVMLSDSYSDRPQAQQLLTDLTRYLHSRLETQPESPQSALYTHQLQVLLEAQSWLSKNANLKLAVTECFFRLQQKQPILRP